MAAMKLLRRLARLRSDLSARTPARQSHFFNHLDAPLLFLNAQQDALRVRDFFEGIFAFGATGSGKSSGVGAACAMAMLRAGWSGVVLCAKPDEARRWEGYLRACGRSDDLILMRPGSRATFNFIEHEMRRPNGPGNDVFNLVSLMMVIVDAARVALNMPAQDDGAFWVSAMRELLVNAIEPLIAATGRFRLDELMRLISSAPSTAEEIHDERWRSASYFLWVMQTAHDAPVGRPLSATSKQAMADYWFGNYARLDPKTRSNIVATLTATISPLLRGHLHEAFCTTTSVTTEMAHEGAVIIVDWPIKTTGPAGALAGQIVKYCWQRTTESRAVHALTRPSFLFVDEAQLFMSRYDPEFQSTARSAMAATVYLTQNLPNYYALQPGRDPKAATDGLLGNFQTKVFHANTDTATNQYASELIGKALQRRASGNWSKSDGWSSGESTSVGVSYQRGESAGRSWGGGSSTNATFSDNGQTSYSVGGSSQAGGQEGKSKSWGRSRSRGESRGRNGGRSVGGGWQEQMDYLVPAAYFAWGLRKGGPENGCLVDAVLVQGGRRFRASGGHSLPVTFQQ